MIAYLSKRRFLTYFFSLLVLAVLVVGQAVWDSNTIIRFALAFVLGLGLNLFCSRFRIIGARSFIPVLIFSLLLCMVAPVLSFKALAVGAVWVYAIYLAFQSWEDTDLSGRNMAIVGICIGVAQLFDPHAIFLVLPIFVLFYQNAVLQARWYFLSIIYMLMVIFCYVAVLYYLRDMQLAWELVPHLEFDVDLFNRVEVRMLLPLTLLLLIFHFLRLGSYQFRYPNRSMKINRLLGLQLLFSFVVLMLGSPDSWLILICLQTAILLAVAFVFNQGSLAVNVFFLVYGLYCLSIALLFGNKVLVGLMI